MLKQPAIHPQVNGSNLEQFSDTLKLFSQNMECYESVLTMKYISKYLSYFVI